jgi:rhodanese-related sulfurtransferase
MKRIFIRLKDGRLALSLLLFLVLVLITGCASSPPVVIDSPVVAIETVSVEEAYQLYQDGTAFLDVRTQEEWQEAHIPGATLLPLGQLESSYSSIPQDQDIVIYCRSGNRSAEAAKFLISQGYTNVSSMEGGINDWIAAGYEVDK